MGRKPLTKIAPVHKEIILSYADHNMSVRAASKSLYMGESTVYSAMSRIRRITGKDPLRFYDLIELVELAKIPDEPEAVPPPPPITFCCDCGKETGGFTAKYCYDCRKVRQSKAAKERGLNKIGNRVWVAKAKAKRQAEGDKR